MCQYGTLAGAGEHMRDVMMVFESGGGEEWEKDVRCDLDEEGVVHCGLRCVLGSLSLFNRLTCEDDWLLVAMGLPLTLKLTCIINSSEVMCPEQMQEQRPISLP